MRVFKIAFNDSSYPISQCDHGIVLALLLMHQVQYLLLRIRFGFCLNFRQHHPLCMHRLQTTTAIGSETCSLALSLSRSVLHSGFL